MGKAKCEVVIIISFLDEQLDSLIKLIGIGGDHSMDITDLADGTTIADCLHYL